jgi:hypothetical protein
MTSSIGLRFLFDQFIGTKSSQYTPAARPLPLGLLYGGLSSPVKVRVYLVNLDTRLRPARAKIICPFELQIISVGDIFIVATESARLPDCSGQIAERIVAELS